MYSRLGPFLFVLTALVVRASADCSSSPCTNGATCVSAGSGYQCNCVPGYVGTNCETELDVCASQPCLNGGTCNQTAPDQYVCLCPGPCGYEQPNCVSVDFIVDPIYQGCTSNVNNLGCGQNGWGGFQGSNLNTDVQTPPSNLVFSGDGSFHIDNQVISGGFGFQTTGPLTTPYYAGPDVCMPFWSMYVHCLTPCFLHCLGPVGQSQYRTGQHLGW